MKNKLLDELTKDLNYTPVSESPDDRVIEAFEKALATTTVESAGVPWEYIPERVIDEGEWV